MSWQDELQTEKKRWYRIEGGPYLDVPIPIKYCQGKRKFTDGIGSDEKYSLDARIQMDL